MGKLKKSSKNKMIAGVIGGLGETFGWDADTITIVRIVTLVLFFVTGSVVFWIYLAMWLILPRDTETPNSQSSRQRYERPYATGNPWEEPVKRKKKIKDAEKIDDNDNWSDF